MDAFVLFVGTGEKVSLEKQKPIILGRGSGALKDVEDTRIARNQVELRFLGNVLKLQNIGSNAITVTTKNNDDRKKKTIQLASQAQHELINGDSFTLILPGENIPTHNYAFRFQTTNSNLKKSNSVNINNEEDDKTIEVPQEEQKQIQAKQKKQKEEESPKVVPKKQPATVKDDPLKNISKSSATYKTVKEKREEQLILAQQEGPVQDEIANTMSLDLSPAVPAVSTSTNKTKIVDMEEDDEESSSPNAGVPKNKEAPKAKEPAKAKEAAKPKEAPKLNKSNDNDNSKLKKSNDSQDSNVKKKPPCKYGQTCYNTKEEHLDQFVHPCKFGSACYRKDPVHRQRYTHGEEEVDSKKPSKEAKPGAAIAIEDDDDEQEEEAVQKDMDVDENQDDAEDDEEVEPETLPDGTTALKGMKEDARITVQGGSSNYEIMKKGGVYSCTCHAWKNQSLPLDKRSCKHLAEYLGEDFEKARLGKKGDAKKEELASELTGINKKSAVTGKSKSTKQVPKLLLANKWEVSTDPSGYWISEKLDGVRAYWNGKVFISRLGNEFTAPDYFKEGLPTEMTLDGELWVGRKMFQLTVGIVRSSGASELWKKLQYRVFDTPSVAAPFEKRMKKIKEYFKEHKAPFVNIVPQEKCTGADHVKKRLQEVEKLGGEGLMLREAGSLYVGNRSNTLLKVKSFFDAEAKILKYEPGKGKHKGKVGAFWCDMGNGKNFSVGTGLSDHDREHPPPVGTIITYRYQELTDAGIPRFPSYVGVRADAVWPPDPDSLPKSTPNPKKGKTKAANNNNNNNKGSDDEDGPPAKKQKKGK